MDIRYISEDYAVSPQVDPKDMTTLVEAGFKTLINNRPDAEITPDICCDEMRAAAEAAGLVYVPNPVINGAMTMEMVQKQADAIAASDGPVFAYCRSGTRSSIVWAFGQAGERPAHEIVAALSKAGYDIPGLDGQLNTLAGRG